MDSTEEGGGDASPSRWSCMRSDILEEIVKLLESRVDILRLRAVCHDWRSLIPLPIRSSSILEPIRLPFPIFPNPDLNPNRRGYFRIIESVVYSVEPLTKVLDPSSTTKTWLIRINELVSGKVAFMFPLSRFAIGNFAEQLPNALNLLDYRVKEICKVDGVEFEAVGETPDLVFNELKSISTKKVVATSGTCKTGNDFAVMALHYGGKLGIWRTGDKKWNINFVPKGSPYEDIAFHKGKFFALDSKLGCVAVDPVSLKVTVITPPLRSCWLGSNGIKYLVKSVNELFMVDKVTLQDDFELGDSDEEDERPYRMDVYKLDEEKGKWVQVNDLGDRAFFLGDDCNFSVSAFEYGGCKANCVYITDDDYPTDNPGRDVVVFDMEDDAARALTTFPGYSNVFWPPPTWLKQVP